MIRHQVRPAGIVAGCAALTLALGGCGAGQQAQTVMVTATGGAGGQVGSIIVRDAQITWDGPVRGNEVYAPGDTAHLQLTVINDATATSADDIAADRLIAVSSPIATAGRITGDARIPDGHVLTAGYDEPVASIALPSTTVVDIGLVGLTESVRAGLTYPVVLTFERAGKLRLELPVENPDILPPRAREDRPTEDRGPELGPGGDPVARR
ncbi:MAG TPA: hypothetical protein VHH34_02510 [Pseudonocardiaceae bacterium]|nr:hypothetical protein [Pseudonocardiaceae bacterium]